MSPRRDPVGRPNNLLPLSLVVLGTGLIFAIALGDKGVSRYLSLRTRLVDYSAEAAERVVRNRHMLERLQALRTDPHILEEAARSMLGVAGDDEIVFVFPEHRAERPY